ncbi:DUF932 domain-containing protein [Dyadobacter jiangsuensis]|uniref:DUF932 domain-containing protein n=1 Tax=Dyadobacter jiangsuensis TaxID=1591085 RepID=UPI000D0DB224
MTCRAESGKPPGLAGPGYQVVQNRDAFIFFDIIADGKSICYETAGAPGHGERILITVKIDDHIVVGKHDMIEQTSKVFTPILDTDCYLLNLENEDMIIRLESKIGGVIKGKSLCR